MHDRKKMDILFIQPQYAHYRKQLFKILSRRYDIHFAFESSSSVYPDQITPVGVSYSFLNRGFGIRALRLAWYLIIYRPGIAITSTSYSSRSIVSFLYAKLFRKGFILWIEEWRKRSLSSQVLKGFWRQFKILIGIKLIKHSDAVIAGGSAAKRYALSLGKHESDIFTAMQCADDLMLKRDTKCDKIKGHSGKYTFLYISRIIPRKGLDLLLKAFALLKKMRADVCLLVAGDGPFRQHCQELATSMEISDVFFLGPVNPHSVVDLYRQADIFVLPSYLWKNLEEPWGLVINEAMSACLPIITTTAVGAAYDLVINGYNGFVVKENSILHLYKTMEMILEMDLVQMGINSRLLFEKRNDFVQMANGFTSAIEHARSKKIY